MSPLEDSNSPTCDFFLGSNPNPNQATKTLDKESAKKVVNYVVRNIKELTNSKEFEHLKGNANEESECPVQVKHSQVEPGTLLGRGNFSHVFEIKRSLLDDIQPGQCVLKMLHAEKLNETPSMFALCALQLAREATILATLNHKNIIGLKGLSHGGLSNIATGRHDGFFVILDRLEGTLKDRIKLWEQRYAKLQFSLHRRRQKLESLFCERLEVALELAEGIEYLHEQRIVHRDLKPENAGFSVDGTLKVFDFDISTILPKESYHDEAFKLTASTGTLLYMSPECGLGQPYNRKTDVYTFALILHEMLSFQEPFENMTIKGSHKDVVLRGGFRPSIPMFWPEQIQQLLRMAWATDFKDRPTMTGVRHLLEEQISEFKQTETEKSPSPQTGGVKFSVQSNSPFVVHTKLSSFYRDIALIESKMWTRTAGR